MKDRLERLGITPFKSEDSLVLAEVDPSKRLLSQDNVFFMREFFDKALDSIVISIPIESEQARIYENLLLNNLPVFSGTYSDNSLALSVPSGTRLLSQQLKFVARDIPNYADIFAKFGETLHEISRSGLGLPEPKASRSLLANFAFAPASKEADGGIILLSPPYELNPNVNILREIDFIDKELSNSKYFNRNEIQKLMGKLGTGLQDGRNQ